jgi:hypothetical protein
MNGVERTAVLAAALFWTVASAACKKERAAPCADAAAVAPKSAPVAPPPPADAPVALRPCHDFGRDLQAMGGDAAAGYPSGAPMPLLMYEHFRRVPSYGHGGWLLDTAGQQYDFHFGDERHDPLRRAIERRKLTPKQFADIVAQAEKREQRASPGEIAAIQALLAPAASAGLPALRGTPCPGSGEAFIQGFIVQKNGSLAEVPIEPQLCGRQYVAKAAPEILKLAGWVHLVLHQPCADPAWSSVFKLQ